MLDEYEPLDEEVNRPKVEPPSKFPSQPDRHDQSSRSGFATTSWPSLSSPSRLIKSSLRPGDANRSGEIGGSSNCLTGLRSLKIELTPATSSSAPLAVSVTSTLPRVAFEYGHTLWAAATIDLACLVVAEVRESDVEGDGDVEAAFLGRDQADLGVDRHSAQVDPLARRPTAPSAPSKQAVVAHGEQLLRVGARLVRANRRSEVERRGRHRW